MWRVAAGALAGSCAVLLLPHWPPLRSLVAVALGVVALLAWRRRRFALCACATVALHCAATLQHALDDRLDPALEGQSLRVRGTVVSVPQGRPDALRFRFAPEHSRAGPRLPRLVELTWYDAPVRIDAAERLVLEVKLRRPRGFANPGGQDLEARMLRERIGATGYVRAVERRGRSPSAWREYPVLLARAAVADSIRRTLGDRPAAGIVAGLAVGLQDALSREQWLTLSRSGTSHLMAISGLHIAMVAFLVAGAAALGQRLRQRWTGSLLARRDVAVVAGVVAAFVYSLLAGWSVPTQRTMVMLAVGALAWHLRRRVGIADGLGLCVCAVLLLDPLAPLAPGFWLSFGAVAAILYAATGFVRRQAAWRSYLRVQAVVTVGLTPVLCGSFGSVSLVSAVVNLYAIPLYTLVVVPAVLVSCAVAGLVPAGGSVLLRATSTLIEASWPLLEIPAGWPLATWSIGGLGLLGWMALVGGAVAVLSPLPLRGRLAGATLVVVACLWRPAPVPLGQARITVLDVGQGLAVVVETKRHTLVYDTGPSFRSGSDTGQLVVVPYLRFRGVRALDRLVVSHDDDDHKGGAASVLRLLPVAELIHGPSLLDAAPAWRADAAQRRLCRRGDRWRWDGVDFEWLHPGPEPHVRDNDSSCVLRVQASNRQSLLIAGDVERVAEAQMLAAATVARVDAIVVPHHGSRTSSTPAFVAATRPRWAIYAAGHRNRWKFPKPEVVARWEGVGAAGLRTSTSGATTLQLGADRPLVPEEWRRRHPKPWRDP